MIRLETEFGGPGLRLSKHLVVVPLQERGVGSVPWVSRVAQPSASHLVVDAAVLVFVTERLADRERAVGSHADVAEVEESMDVAAQGQAVGHGMRSSMGEGLDM